MLGVLNNAHGISQTYSFWGLTNCYTKVRPNKKITNKHLVIGEFQLVFGHIIGLTS